MTGRASRQSCRWAHWVVAVGLSLTATAAGAQDQAIDNGGRLTSVHAPVPLAPVAIVVDAGWSATTAVPPAFFWGGTIPVFASSGPFLFSGPGCVRVTDDFLKGDQFRVYDNNVALGDTPAVAVDSSSPEVGPDAAFADPTYSSCSFPVGGGAHSISIEVIGLSFSGGRGYIRVDSSGVCTCGDSDGDGVPDAVDVCDDTVVPESVPTRRLGVNRWALVDGDGIFDTTAPPGGGEGPGLSFTLDDTAGCTCEQVIETLGIGLGHGKYGCSTGVMRRFTRLVAP